MKNGIHTTEFWLGLITVILTYFNNALGLNIPVTEVMYIAGLVIVYITGRVWLKSKQIPFDIPALPKPIETTPEASTPQQ